METYIYLYFKLIDSIVLILTLFHFFKQSFIFSIFNMLSPFFMLISGDLSLFFII